MRERERERKREGKMTWTSVGEEIMTWRCLEEKFFFSQLRVLIYTSMYPMQCMGFLIYSYNDSVAIITFP